MFPALRFCDTPSAGVGPPRPRDTQTLCPSLQLWRRAESKKSGNPVSRFRRAEQLWVKKTAMNVARIYGNAAACKTRPPTRPHKSRPAAAINQPERTTNRPTNKKVHLDCNTSHLEQRIACWRLFSQLTRTRLLNTLSKVGWPKAKTWADGAALSRAVYSAASLGDLSARI